LNAAPDGGVVFVVPANPDSINGMTSDVVGQNRSVTPCKWEQ
jgi:hypothetical protein